MLDPAALAVFAVALAVAAGSPGPSVAALVARVLAAGPGSVLPFLGAMWLGEAIWLACAIFGLAVIAQTFQVLFAALKWAGIAYLAWLAWKMWHAPVAGAAALPRGGRRRLFGAGLALTLGNPKIMVFYLALLPAILDLDAIGLLGWAELTMVLFLVLAAVDLAWVFAAARARGLLRSPTGQRVANRVSAGLMAGAAGAIATR